MSAAKEKREMRMGRGNIKTRERSGAHTQARRRRTRARRQPQRPEKNFQSPLPPNTLYSYIYIYNRPSPFPPFLPPLLVRYIYILLIYPSLFFSRPAPFIVPHIFRIPPPPLPSPSFPSIFPPPVKNHANDFKPPRRSHHRQEGEDADPSAIPIAEPP